MVSISKRQYGTGSIIHRPLADGSDSWLLKYYSGSNAKTGKPKQAYKTVRGTRKEAEKKLRELLSAVDNGTHVDPSRITVTIWLRRWVKEYAPMDCHSNATIERYDQFIERHIIPAIGEMALQKLTTAHVQGMYAEKLSSGRLTSAEGLSKQTVHHMHRCLSNALSTAVAEGLIANNPCSAAKSPRPDDAEIICLDDQQTARMLEAAANINSPNLYPIILLAVATGMRRGELLALKWSEVDLENLTLRVRNTLEETKLGLRFKSPKTKNARRTISLPLFAVDVLRDHKANQDALRLRLGVGSDEDRLVFETFLQDEFGPIRPRNVTKSFDRFIKTVDVPRVTLHGLRHTHATSAIRAGENIVAVSRRLGHAKPSITLNVYSHLIEGDDAYIAVNLDSRLKQIGMAEQG
jgi:integrase